MSNKDRKSTDVTKRPPAKPERLNEGALEKSDEGFVVRDSAKPPKPDPKDNS